MEGLGLSDMDSISFTGVGSYIMTLGATWGSYPVGTSWGLVTVIIIFHTSLGMEIIEYLLSCHSFERVKFSYVARSECSYIRFSQFSGTVTFLMCYTVENVSSKITWYRGQTCPVLVFNTITTDPA